MPLSHGTRMRNAMEDAHKDVQRIEFPEEGHGVRIAEDRAVYDEAVFKLLARTIGPGEPPIPAAITATAASR